MTGISFRVRYTPLGLRPGANTESPTKVRWSTAGEPMALQAAGYAAEAFAAGPLAFVSPDAFVLACGGALRFVPAQREAAEEHEAIVWTEGASVGALDASPAHGVVAYAERQRSLQDPRIFICAVETRTVSRTLSCAGELGIVALAFCRDAAHARLVALGEIPTNNITVWDWGRGRILASVSSQGSMARSVSFDPQDCNLIASIGTDLELWTLTPDGELLADPATVIDKGERELTAHCWAPGKSLFLATDSGEICHVNARTGCKVYGTGWVKVSDGPIGALALSSRHVLVGGSAGMEGVVHWVSFPLEGSSDNMPYLVERSTPCVDGPVTGLAVSPDWSSLVITTAQGTIATCNLMHGPDQRVGDEGEEQTQIAVQEVGQGFPDGGVNAMTSMTHIPVVCTAGQRGTVTLWMAPALQIISSIVVSAAHETTCVAVAEQARVLVAGTSAGQVVALDISQFKSPRIVFRARLHLGTVTAISVSEQWIASAALGPGNEEPFIALCRIRSGEFGGSVNPVGRVRFPVKGHTPRLLHMQMCGDVLFGTTSGGLLLRIPMPDMATEPTAEPLALEAETVNIGVDVHAFTLEQSVGDEMNVTLVGWGIDRSLRCWTVSLGGALEAHLVSESTKTAAQGTAVATAPDHTGTAVVLAGMRNGGLTLLQRTALNDPAPCAARHLGASAAIKGGFSAEPSANRPYEPMIAGRGGVSGVVVGAGVLRGWIVSAGRDGSLISQALDATVSAPRPSLGSSVGAAEGVLKSAQSLSQDASDTTNPGDGAGAVVSAASLADGMPLVWQEWAKEGGASTTKSLQASGPASGPASVDKDDAAQQILKDLATLKDSFQEILAHNKSCPDIERLERDELTIDRAWKTEMVAAADAQAAHVSATIQRENVLADLQAQKIRSNCHDTMETALLSIEGIDASAPAGLKIASYPVAKLSPAETTRLERVRILRRLELGEQALVKDAGLPVTSVTGPDGLRMTAAEMQVALAERGGANAHKDQKEEDEEEEPNAESAAQKLSGDEMLLYDPLQLSTREQRLNQVELQRSRIRSLKTTFNDTLKKAIKDKSSVIDKLDEKKARLAEIKEACDDFLFAKTGTEKLYVDDRYALASSEEDGQVLQVQDSEIKAPKFLSAAERAAKEAEEAEERRRQEAAGSDDAVGRALHDMMYGTLEARKQDDHNVLEEKPVFFDTPKEQLNEEQIKAIAEYEKKLKNAADDEDKQRKALEAEAKKIKVDMQQLIADFHVRLAQLAEHRLAVERSILQAEFEVVLLLQAIVRGEDRDIKIKELTRQVETAHLDRDVAHDAVAQLRAEIDAFRVTYETVLNEDKACDKAFKKEIADSPVADELTKLFKKRSYSHEAMKGGRAMQHPDPFMAVVMAQEEALPRPEPLDWEAEGPDGMSSMMAQHLHQLRERKIDCELEVKRKAAELMQLNARLKELSSLEKESAELCDKLQDELDKLQMDREMEAYNLTLLLDVRQGQIEVNVEQMMDDNFDAALLEVAQISQLNALITALGTEKVEMMTDSKSVRNKIHGLKWTNESLDFKAMEVTENIKYVQLMWVTKDMQQILREGGAEERKQHQIRTLEKQIEHSQHLHELKVQDMKSRLFRAHKQIREKELENNKLTEYVQDLAVSVAQREKIMRVRRSEDQSGDDSEYKMQEVVWRRLVLEEARQQSEDIAILKAEVDRLRQRTFPSFAKNYSTQHSRG